MTRGIELRTITVTPKSNGYVIWRGASLIDGAPIVVIMTGLREASTNSKTGAMVQTYILRDDIAPVQAIKTGAAKSICGDCLHLDAGSCFVNEGQGPHMVFDGFQRGIYPVATAEESAELCAGLLVRLGSYGDPAAVPASVWESILSRSAGHTGYTHQWRRARVRREYHRFLMASVDTADQQGRAVAKGWRTFRAKLEGDSRLPGEIVCPASKEADYRQTCETCGACDGAGRNPRRASVVINAHGLVWKVQRFARALKALAQKKRYRIKRKS